MAAAFSLAVWGAALLFAPAAGAQGTAPSAPEERVPMAPAELEELVGLIALYPDDLVSIVLPASTYPLQIVQAARYLEEYETNSDLEPNEDWDDSVIALLNYPEVIELMNDDLDWTWALGEAALYQQTELLGAIQDFRDRAYAAGNLETDDRQDVTQDTAGTIAIVPADPEVIYVPYYEPRHVVVHQPYPVYHYYPRAYPVYYYPYAYSHSFGSRFFWGVTTAFSIGWNSHSVNVHHYSHYAHPYYGHYYHSPRYRRHSVSASYGGNIWRPSYYSGARQQDTATVSDRNRALGATTSSRVRLRVRDQRSANTAERIRQRSQLTAARQNTLGTRRGNVPATTGPRAATVTADAVNRARAASVSNRSSNRRAGTLTGTRVGSSSRAARENARQNLGVQRDSTQIKGASPNTRSRSAAALSRTNVRNQPSTQGSRTPTTFGGVNSRQRKRSAARQATSAQRSTVVRPATVQRGSFGGAASRSAPSYGGRVNPGPARARPPASGNSRVVSGSGASASARANAQRQIRNQR